jgi:hypothetical protein
VKSVFLSHPKNVQNARSAISRVEQGVKYKNPGSSRIKLTIDERIFKDDEIGNLKRYSQG